MDLLNAVDKIKKFHVNNFYLLSSTFLSSMKWKKQIRIAKP